VNIEDKYVIALAVLCVLILVGGTVLAHFLSKASPRVVRIAWPVTALATGAIFATFALIARTNAH
jgi:hypothetical protein